MLGNLQTAAFHGCHHQLHLLQFGALDAEERGHLDDLSGTHKIAGIGTETFQARAKLAASHSFGYVEANPALPVLIMQAKFADYHYELSSNEQARVTKLQLIVSIGPLLP